MYIRVTVTIFIVGYGDGGHVILSNSGSTPVVSKRMAEVDPELFLRLKHGVIMDRDSTVLHLEPMAQDRLKFAARHQYLTRFYFSSLQHQNQHKFKGSQTV